MIQPIKNNILFKFIDKTLNDSLVSSTKSGILLSRNITYDEQKDPRWAEVVALGPDVDDEIKKYKYIFIEPLQWTIGLKLDDTKVWKTDDTKILAVSNEIMYRA